MKERRVRGWEEEERSEGVKGRRKRGMEKDRGSASVVKEKKEGGGTEESQGYKEGMGNV